MRNNYQSTRTAMYRLKLALRYLLTGNFLKKSIPFSFGEIAGHTAGGIPKLVIQTTKMLSLPREFARDIINFRTKNPGFQFVTFDQENMTRYMENEFAGEIILEAYQNCVFGVMQSDIFKYAYVYKNGGISLDLSKYVEKGLSQIFETSEAELILSHEKNVTSFVFRDSVEARTLFGVPPKMVINWCFASAPNNPLLKSILQEIEANYSSYVSQNHEDVKLAIWRATGPIAFNIGLLNGLCVYDNIEIDFIGVDFDSSVWPKFISSSYVNSRNSHYSEFQNQIIFRKAT